MLRYIFKTMRLFNRGYPTKFETEWAMQFIYELGYGNKKRLVEYHFIPIKHDLEGITNALDKCYQIYYEDKT